MPEYKRRLIRPPALGLFTGTKLPQPHRDRVELLALPAASSSSAQPGFSGDGAASSGGALDTVDGSVGAWGEDQFDGLPLLSAPDERPPLESAEPATFFTEPDADRRPTPQQQQQQQQHSVAALRLPFSDVLPPPPPHQPVPRTADADPMQSDTMVALSAMRVAAHASAASAIKDAADRSGASVPWVAALPVELRPMLEPSHGVFYPVPAVFIDATPAVQVPSLLPRVH